MESDYEMVRSFFQQKEETLEKDRTKAVVSASVIHARVGQGWGLGWGGGSVCDKSDNNNDSNDIRTIAG